MPTIASIGIAPLKGTRLIHPEAVDVDAGGVAADRRFVLLDARDRIVSSRTHAVLLRIRTSYDRGAEPGGRLVVVLPDGTEVAGTVEDGEPVAPSLWRRRRPGRRVDGPWQEVLSDVLGSPVRLVRLTDPLAGSDAQPVSLVSVASVRRLEEAAGGFVDPGRFRMLLTLEGCEPFEEETWVGRLVRVGGSVLEVTGTTPRCVLTTRDPGTGERDLDTLGAIARARGAGARDSLDCGVYARVRSAGTVGVGDRVDLC